jgi:mRNA interferase MazF
MPSRGEIWFANLNPSHGTEPGNTRPVLVIQAQGLLNAGHPSTLVIPLTTNVVDDAEPLRVRVPASGRLRKDSDLLIDQLRAIDNRRRPRASRNDLTRITPQRSLRVGYTRRPPTSPSAAPRRAWPRSWRAGC